MRRIIPLLVLCLTILALLAMFTPAHADGIIIPEPPPCIDCPPPPCPFPRVCPPPSPVVQLVIRYHRVTVTIDNQVATTHVDQVFHNPNSWPVEGVYMFPIPVDAAVSSFSLWVDGKAVKGEVLDADQARRVYQKIVNSLRDPALLEYAGRGALKASIFPIPPQGEQRIELEYVQTLTADNGLVRYVYPLNTEKFSLWPLEQVKISVDVRASQTLRAVYSPSHKIDLDRQSDRHVRAGYEASQVTPDSDFALYYSLGEVEALHLLSYRDPADKDDPQGYFLVLLAPRPQAPERILPKDLILVLDRSGSMEGEKFQQAQAAIRYILEHLNPEDRFNVIAFSTGLDSYATRLRPASEAAQAVAWVDRLGAQGSTDINRALLEAAALANPESTTYLIFLTDGLPTEGVVESQDILENFQRAAPSGLRLFAFGVGYDVDTFLLDSLAQAHHGASSYVLPEERLDEALSAFYGKISTPVLTDLELDFGDISVFDLYPDPLPDLFSGSQIVLVGRYRQGGETTIRLNGMVDGVEQTLEFPEQTFTRIASTSYPESTIPRLWATRKIGHLLNQVRLRGPDQETIDQIVKLSIRFGIVTPYTSYLVTEEAPLGVEEQERIAQEQFNQLQILPAAPVSGQDAVQKAAGQGFMAEAEAPAEVAVEAAGRVQVAGSRAFVLDGEKWIDTAFDPERMTPVAVPFLSQDYFALVAARPDLGAAFALGPRVIAIADGIAYEVVAPDVQAPPVKIPATPLALPLASATPVVVAPTELPVTQPGSFPTPSASPSPAACGNLLAPLFLFCFAVLTRSRR